MDRRLDFAEVRGDLLIAGDQPFAAVDDEHDDVGGFERPSPLNDDEFVERIGARTEHSAGIHQPERLFEPLCRLVNDVTSGAGDGRDDGAPCTGDPVEQGGLADVRSADQHDGSKRLGAAQGHLLKCS